MYDRVNHSNKSDQICHNEMGRTLRYFKLISLQMIPASCFKAAYLKLPTEDIKKKYWFGRGRFGDTDTLMIAQKMAPRARYRTKICLRTWFGRTFIAEPPNPADGNTFCNNFGRCWIGYVKVREFPM